MEKLSNLKFWGKKWNLDRHECKIKYLIHLKFINRLIFFYIGTSFGSSRGRATKFDNYLFLPPWRSFGSYLICFDWYLISFPLLLNPELMLLPLLHPLLSGPSFLIFLFLFFSFVQLVLRGNCITLLLQLGLLFLELRFFSLASWTCLLQTCWNDGWPRACV